MRNRLPGLPCQVGMRSRLPGLPCQVGMRSRLPGLPCRMGMRNRLPGPPCRVGMRNHLLGLPCRVGMRSHLPGQSYQVGMRSHLPGQSYQVDMRSHLPGLPCQRDSSSGFPHTLLDSPTTPVPTSSSCRACLRSRSCLPGIRNGPLPEPWYLDTHSGTHARSSPLGMRILPSLRRGLGGKHNHHSVQHDPLDMRVLQCTHCELRTKPGQASNNDLACPRSEPSLPGIACSGPSSCAVSPRPGSNAPIGR